MLGEDLVHLLIFKAVIIQPQLKALEQSQPPHKQLDMLQKPNCMPQHWLALLLPMSPPMLHLITRKPSHQPHEQSHLGDHEEERAGEDAL